MKTRDEKDGSMRLFWTAFRGLSLIIAIVWGLGGLWRVGQGILAGGDGGTILIIMALPVGFFVSLYLFANEKIHKFEEDRNIP